MSDKFQVILNTCPSQEVAESLARRLVENGLAACVNILPSIQSVYRWNENVEIATEWLLIIKSRRDRYDQIQETLVAHHPYELPEIIALPIRAGLPAYLAWIDATVRPSV